MIDRADDDREALRQSRLLGVLWRAAPVADLAGWLREPPRRAARGLAAYRANAQALAGRALSAAYPTVAELVGAESFAALACAFWQRHPPQRGDIAVYGAALAGFIEVDAQLASEPYLADSARLDWAVHVADGAADGAATPPELQRLGSDDPARLVLRLQSGLALLASRWPVVSIWQAHHGATPECFDAARAALERRAAEHALVWRDGWRVQVTALAAADAVFMQAVQAGRSLASALDCAGAGFAFEPWLLRALRHGWLAALDPLRADVAASHR